MTEVENFQTKQPNNFDINEADRSSIKAAVKRVTIQSNELSIDQRKDLIEDYLIEQRHTVFGECDEINYLEHLVKQPLSIDLKKLVGQQLAAITIQNYDANKRLTEISSQQTDLHNNMFWNKMIQLRNKQSKKLIRKKPNQTITQSTKITTL